MKRWIGRMTSPNRCPTGLSHRLDQCNHEALPLFSFNGEKCWCKCVDVYDGDTVTVIFEYRRQMIKDRIRLWGIDTPEIRTRDQEEKKAGFEARDYLREQILDKFVWVEFLKEDKYGRSLGKIYRKSNDTESLNDELVKKGMAKEYMRD